MDDSQLGLMTRKPLGKSRKESWQDKSTLSNFASNMRKLSKSKFKEGDSFDSSPEDQNRNSINKKAINPGIELLKSSVIHKSNENLKEHMRKLPNRMSARRIIEPVAAVSESNSDSNSSENDSQSANKFFDKKPSIQEKPPNIFFQPFNSNLSGSLKQNQESASRKAKLAENEGFKKGKNTLQIDDDLHSKVAFSVRSKLVKEDVNNLVSNLIEAQNTPAGEDGSLQKTCMMCLATESNIIIQPCGHGGVCFECGLEILRTGNVECHICRGVDLFDFSKSIGS